MLNDLWEYATVDLAIKFCGYMGLRGLESPQSCGACAGHLRGTFFFKRGHPTRGNVKALFSTIAYRLALRIPWLKGPIPWAVENYLSFVGSAHAIQFEQLVLAPCQSLPNHNGNLLVWCPACPEPGLNSDPNCSQTPHHLRHCNQSQHTLDGNFQCNQFNKNTDPDDVSLCRGKGYFPPNDEYKEYLSKIKDSTDKSTCNYLKVVNKQDKKKFKNMAITGTVNCQCSHVFILSCVDLQYGVVLQTNELRQRKSGQPLDSSSGLRSKTSTYDIACEYYIKLEERFKKHFPDLVDDVKQMRWGVPSLHVQGHQDSCNYLFGTAYMECVGHFHGETAEHYWPEANQLGPHVRQMNNGHRQDTMIIHHVDWNHKKTMKIAVTLANARYAEKRDHFIGLSISFRDRLNKWKVMDRTPSKNGKEATSVYKHRTSKVPSQTAIYQAMLAQDDNFQSTMIPRNKLARLLNDALKIQDELQNRSRSKVSPDAGGELGHMREHM
ncbi:hypothetical protein B0H13DRAFT_2511652 [Mycena leptocephala]|nr:hypothetical protein B0H13DRAFT_2511652 [Mycena leptocephala]